MGGRADSEQVMTPLGVWVLMTSYVVRGHGIFVLCEQGSACRVACISLDGFRFGNGMFLAVCCKELSVI